MIRPRYSRGRGRRSRLAAAPIAFAGTEHAHRIDARERIRRDTARLLDTSDTESLALTLGVDPMTWLAATGATRDGSLTVSTPGRDSRGRVLRHERFKSRRTTYTV